MVTTLTDSSTGVFVVSTETSGYVLDLSARTALRVPGVGAGSAPNLRPARVTELRRDGEAVPLAVLVSCEVGKPLSMHLDVRGDGVLTLRETTLVRSIDSLETAEG